MIRPLVDPAPPVGESVEALDLGKSGITSRQAQPTKPVKVWILNLVTSTGVTPAGPHLVDGGGRHALGDAFRQYPALQVRTGCSPATRLKAPVRTLSATSPTTSAISRSRYP